MVSEEAAPVQQEHENITVGLHICKQIADKIGCKIVYSPDGLHSRGHVFTLVMTLKPMNKHQAQDSYYDEEGDDYSGTHRSDVESVLQQKGDVDFGETHGGRSEKKSAKSPSKKLDVQS